MGNVVYEAENETGSHLYATEKPELLARGLRTMFGKGGGAYYVVKCVTVRLQLDCRLVGK